MKRLTEITGTLGGRLEVDEVDSPRGPELLVVLPMHGGVYVRLGVQESCELLRTLSEWLAFQRGEVLK